MKKKYFLFIFLFILPLFFCQLNAVELNTYGITLTKDFELTFDKNYLWDSFTAPISSLSSADQIILAYDAGFKKTKEKKTEFIINYYKLNVYDIKSKQAKLLWTSPKLNDFENTIAYGDLFNNNTKALYIFYKDTIDEYKYNGKKFVKQTFKLPVQYYIKQAKIADIDNDGKNELICFISDKNGKFPFAEKLSLLICKANEKNEFDVAYFGTFTYKGGDISSDKIVCIDDIYNTGQNKLVIKLGQTNIGQSEYKVLSFQNGKLYKEKIIDQENNISLLDLENTSHDSQWYNKITGEFSVIKFNGKNYIISSMLPQTITPSTSIAVSSLTEKKLIIYAQIRLTNTDSSATILPLNLEGKDANSRLLYLTENGNAVVYKIDSIEE